jgi:signal transduction histidine kinase
MRDRLITELVADEIEVLNQEQVLEVLRLGLISDISTQIDESVRQAQDTLSSLKDAVAMEHNGEQVVAALNQINNESIRKLSSELWHQKISTSSMKLLDLMRAMAHTRPFRPTYFIPPVALVSFVILNRSMSSQDASEIVFIWLSYVTTISVATNYLCRKIDQIAFGIYCVAIALLACAGILTYFFTVSQGLTKVESLKWSIMASVASAIFMPWFSMGSGISAHRRAVLQQLRTSIDQVEIRRLAISNERFALNKQISTYLHGTVQANMSAAILRLQQSIEVGDRSAATQALMEARDALNLKWDASLGTAIDDLDSTLSQIADGWLGLVNISYTIDSDVPQRLNTMIYDVVVDAINNAVRHGEAENIEIAIFSSANCTNIVITNNGHELDVIETGLGTETLNSYAPGNWTRTSLSNGKTELRVQLANR